MALAMHFIMGNKLNIHDLLTVRLVVGPKVTRGRGNIMREAISRHDRGVIIW